MAGNDLDQAVPFVIPDVSASQREPENKMTDSKWGIILDKLLK